MNKVSALCSFALAAAATLPAVAAPTMLPSAQANYCAKYTVLTLAATEQDVVESRRATPRGDYTLYAAAMDTKDVSRLVLISSGAATASNRGTRFIIDSRMGNETLRHTQNFETIDFGDTSKLSSVVKKSEAYPAEEVGTDLLLATRAISLYSDCMGAAVKPALPKLAKVSPQPK